MSMPAPRATSGQRAMSGPRAMFGPLAMSGTRAMSGPRVTSGLRMIFVQPAKLRNLDFIVDYANLVSYYFWQ